MLSRRKQIAGLCVHGWIRENYIDYNNIPSELYQICLKMYFLATDAWSRTKSDDRYRFKDGFWNSFGELILSKGDVMEWRFKINGKLPAAIFIGIMEAHKASPDIPPFAGHGGVAYYCFQAALCGQDEIELSYVSHEYVEDVITRHDQIIMTLDMTGNKALLSYKTMNTEKLSDVMDHGVAFKLDSNKKYCKILYGCFVLLSWPFFTTFVLLSH